MQPIAQPIMQEQIVQTPMQELQPAQRHEIEADYIEVDLPSGYRFYDFKHVYIKPFKHRHIRKIIQGQENRNPRYIAEVLNSVVKCDLGYDDTVFRLCKEDYTYLQYWERRHSFPNMQYNQPCVCQNPEHIAKVNSGELKEGSLHFMQPVTVPKLQEIKLDASTDIDFDKFLPQEIKDKYPNCKLHTMYVADYLDMMDLAETDIQKNDDEGIDWFLSAIPASLLTIIKDDGSVMTFKERFELVEDLMPESVMMLNQAKDLLPEFGVKSTINAKCPRCGAITTTELVLNAHSFLPANYMAGNSRS